LTNFFFTEHAANNATTSTFGVPTSTLSSVQTGSGYNSSSVDQRDSQSSPVLPNYTASGASVANSELKIVKSPVPSPAQSAAQNSAATHNNQAGLNGLRPPGSFALPGIHSVAAAAARQARAKSSNSDGGDPRGGSGQGQSEVPEAGTHGDPGEMNSSGATQQTQIRSIYSPDNPGSNHIGALQSPLNGGIIGMSGFPTAAARGDPGLPPGHRRENAPSPHLLKNERPSTLGPQHTGSVIGVNPTINNNNNHHGVATKGKKTRWLLCYPSGGTTGASSESPSPPHEEAPRVDSQASTPSPTDGGFKIPNSQSTERPTSLPVALLNSSQRNGKFL
jgi:hypothetical protein